MLSSSARWEVVFRMDIVQVHAIVGYFHIEHDDALGVMMEYFLC